MRAEEPVLWFQVTGACSASTARKSTSASSSVSTRVHPETSRPVVRPPRPWRFGPRRISPSRLLELDTRPAPASARQGTAVGSRMPRQDRRKIGTALPHVPRRSSPSPRATGRARTNQAPIHRQPASAAPGSEGARGGIRDHALNLACAIEAKSHAADSPRLLFLGLREPRRSSAGRRLPLHLRWHVRRFGSSSRMRERYLPATLQRCRRL